MPQVTRPPVIAIMGHVDHGKTSLLDAIRKTDVAAGEAGGITQHIGAYQIEHNGRKLTFLDTPGHAAFSKMRSRGANVTDIVVLVVAADDGVKPQTIESIQHIKQAKVDYIVAINKIDMPGADIIKVKTQLAEQEVFLEGFGGNVSAVEVSAKTKAGIPDLLDLLLLTADVKELKADPEASLHGVVIESGKDARKGIYATVLVQEGTLAPRQNFFVGKLEERVRQMTDHTGKVVLAAQPGMPVSVIGWTQVPEVGAVVSGTPTDETRQEHVVANVEEGKLRMILKADVIGSLEALIGSMPPEIAVVAASIGDVSESDVLLAQTTGSRILGFNVKVPKDTQELSVTSNVKIKTYRIIYELLEDLEKIVFAFLNPKANEVTLGTAEIIAQFDIKGDKIAGCKVTEGEIKRGQNIFYYLKRGGVEVGSPRVRTMRAGKADVESVKAPSECGIVFRGTVRFAIGDTIECYTMKEI
ncbi:MAG: translation initiation factor IF-2 [Candidatus Woesebacteria bacterium]